MRVFKYELPLCDRVSITMPREAEILAVKIQNGKPYIWAKIDIDATSTQREFRIAGTGHELNADNLTYIDSFFYNTEDLVFHVFEIRRKS